MLPRPHRARRGRRTDFVPVMELLATSGVPVPPADRATLRRFRRLVADLGADFYVAVSDERIVGVVHATYTRQLVTAPRARVESLVVAPAVRRQGIGTALLALVATRARRRGCSALTCLPPLDAAEAPCFLIATGWRRGASLFIKNLDRADDDNLP